MLTVGVPELGVIDVLLKMFSTAGLMEKGTNGRVVGGCDGRTPDADEVKPWLCPCMATRRRSVPIPTLDWMSHSLPAKPCCIMYR